MVITNHMVHKIRDGQNKSNKEFEKLNESFLDIYQKKLKIEK
jgi:hypothetical protein